MEFRDLKRQYELNKVAIDKAIARVLADATFIGGKPVSNLEKRLADYVGVKHCTSCANGTDALELALNVWNIGTGDAVFVPDFTFFASGEVVSRVGATPIFVDIDKDTFNISIDSLRQAYSYVADNTNLVPRVIVAVDLFGLPADYNTLREFANNRNMLILEDSAQGFGGAIGNKKAGSFGDISTTSFFPAKPLGCYGDGGAIFTDNDAWNEIINSLKVHGKGNSKYDNIRIGVNSRLDTLQAAILDVKLTAFAEHELNDVNRIADRYNRGLHGFVKTPVVPEGYMSSWAQYAIMLEGSEQRDNLKNRLADMGIPTMVYYPKPMHMQKAFEPYTYELDYTNSMHACERILELPMHPYMTVEEIDTVVNAVLGCI